MSRKGPGWLYTACLEGLLFRDGASRVHTKCKGAGAVAGVVAPSPMTLEGEGYIFP